ncbi:cyanophycinase [Zeaxanthinibacter sp. PT1]|uniref:cyanophycinase n=1 Tax=Zeaxanthinibacter TaxID=561554 RepID=UPI002349635B|nr:cyanophycinase [Zeaxanthinibacter sp. PT1]MDC6350077.1 cyanophycinase [Zeaxanthinibacter sp. PT1]
MRKSQKLLICIVITLIMFPANNLLGQNSYKLRDNETIGPEKGSLIITGDGIYGIFKDKFMELIGGADAPVIVIPTAGSSDVLSDEFLENYKQRFIKSGLTNVTVLHTRDPEEANTDEFIEPIKNAVGVIFSGGRQWRHADSYLNTKTHDELIKLLSRGGVIAGGSAGATIQGSYLARGDSKGNTKMMGDHEVGLSFIKNVAIDQHLLKRNRQFDMFEILDNRPELLGIGIDEGTGIIVQGDTFKVIGKSYVVMYDGTRWSEERDTIYKLPKGSREFYTLKSGDEYNLKTRSVITYRNREYVNLTEKDLKIYCGVYKLIGTDVKSELFVNDDTLFSKANGQTFPLLPESETRFYISQTDVYLDFIFDSNDKVLKVKVPIQNQTWEKLN